MENKGVIADKDEYFKRLHRLFEYRKNIKF